MVKTGYVNEQGEWSILEWCAPFVDKAKYPASARRFGFMWHPIDLIYKWHNGQDYAAPEGTQVTPVCMGIIHSKGYDDVNGNFIRVLHPNGMVSGYAHLREMPDIPNGVKVGAGDVIGIVGSTGKSTGAHLHLTLWTQVGKSSIDPTLLIP